MITNFDYLKEEPAFASFADVAVSAERLILFDPEASIINSRRAMEFAVKWIYSVDNSLERPYQDNLVSLMGNEDFRELVSSDIWKRMDYIRRCGNNTAHGVKKLGLNEAMLCLENLAVFMDFVDCCYGTDYHEHHFNDTLIKERQEKAKADRKAAKKTEEKLKAEEERSAKRELDLEALMAENASLKEELSKRREEREPSYVPKPLDLSEYDTRKLYIDAMLRDAGWTEGKDWINEVELSGMPTESGKGYADYVLYDDSHRPLAVIEAKKTCKDVAVGRHQAKLYADILERDSGRRPVIFLTNGFTTHIIDGQYPERKCAAFYSKKDLAKYFNLMTMRTSLASVSVDKDIAGRYYQEAAIKAVCRSFDEKNRRKALLVMATGSGKTRTVIALVKILLNHGWIRNVLFLADRNSLVTQAKRNFVNLLPDLSCTNLVEEKGNISAHAVFSTYQTMIGCIDSVNDEDGRKLFTCGHFDLVICDEAHRSIYNKYQDIFDYFDAPLVGLTATPKDEVDKNTYQVFELENGVPTFGYELAEAVKDGYLVDFQSVESKLKFLTEGIVYDELPEDEREEYEDKFTDDDGRLPAAIDSDALNTWLFNEDTIKKVLAILMENGLKINYGERLGKTIIFAKNHNHAEKILEIFNKEYPSMPGFAGVIDNYMIYAQSAIDEFSEPDKLPQIAISVDMLDTGIDIPEILNLVFFKKVMSKAKFWQMIGRGTRLCPGLIDGEDKSKFYIFDFCGNFEFFRMNKGSAAVIGLPLQSAVWNLEFEIVYKLQDAEFQTDRLIAYRKALVDRLAGKVKEIPRESFATKLHLKYVVKYASEVAYDGVTYGDTRIARDEVSPLVLPDKDDASAVRFDALMFGLEIANLSGKSHKRGVKDLRKKVKGIASVSTIPEITAKKDIIEKILKTDYVERAGIDEFEHIRKELRDLMKYLPNDAKSYDTNFTDDIISTEWNDSDLSGTELSNYREKAEFYLKQHENEAVIGKLKLNKPLTDSDVKELEKILWNDLGTKEDYDAECGGKPLGEFVRSVVGLDMNAAKEAFPMYLSDTSLDNRQIYFVNQIVEYIVHNGMMADLSVLSESPFTDFGTVGEIFENDLDVFNGIRKVIETINANAAA